MPRGIEWCERTAATKPSDALAEARLFWFFYGCISFDAAFFVAISLTSEGDRVSTLLSIFGVTFVVVMLLVAFNRRDLKADFMERVLND